MVIALKQELEEGEHINIDLKDQVASLEKELENALLNNLEIPFYGDGSTLRDYTHVNDIVDGILGAIQNLNGFNIFNLGESKTTSLAELIKYLEKYTNKKANLKILPAQQGDVPRTFADITKAKKLINYNPKVDIENGLMDYVQYYNSINKNNNI